VKTLFRPQFWIDLEEGVSYLAEKASPEIAQRWHAEVLATVTRMEQQPGLGRLRTDLKPSDIRSLVLRRYPRYLLFYRWSEDTLEVLRIKHGMMDLPRLFRDAP
jgi:toxin ParE1/3/4